MSDRRYLMLALVTGAQAGASLVQQGLGALAPFLALAFTLDKAHVGFVFASFSIGSAMMTAPSGLAVDAWGERRVILASGIVTGGALAVAALAHSYAWLIAWLTIAGIGYAASTPAGGRAILLWFDRHRGMAMSVRQTGVPVGGIVGALLLPLVAAHAGYRAALAVAGALCFVLAVVAAAFYREPAASKPAPRSLRSLVAAMAEISRDRRTILVTLTCMVLVSVQTIMLTFLTLTFVGPLRSSIAVAAAALAVAQVGAVVGRIGWGAISDRAFGGDRITPLAIIVVITALASIALGYASAAALAAAFAVAFVLGFSSAGWNGLFSAALAEIGGTERAGSALGVALTGVFAMGFVAPPAFGAYADARGLDAAWVALGFATLVGLAPALGARRAMARAARA